MTYFETASPSFIKKEKAKARELRVSQWWKQQLGKGICYHCEQKFTPADLTMDHLIPISRGGESNKKNCVPCCKECNTKKGMKTRADMALDEIAQGRNTSTEAESSNGPDDSDEE
ncbi:MAG: HNH endonuclease [Bdellovibrionota bacterium]